VTIHAWLSIQPSHPLPIQVQLVEQIKWLVGAGRLKPEDKLSPVVSLAGELGINRNTVQAAYMQLREEGIFQTQQGKGTWIADTDATRELIRARERFAPFVIGLLQDAKEPGFDADRFAMLSVAAIQLQNVARASKILLVDSEKGEHAFYRDEIARRTGARPALNLLEEMAKDADRAAEIAAAFDAIAVALPYAEEVRSLLPALSGRIVAIAAAIDPGAIVDMARLGAGKKVGVLFGSRSDAVWIADNALPSELICEVAAAGDDDAIRALIRTSDKVYASPSVFERVRRLAPEKAEPLRLKLESSCMRVLQLYSY